MSFEDEPDWMKAARKAPVQSTWESRQPPAPPSKENQTAGKQAAMS